MRRSSRTLISSEAPASLTPRLNNTRSMLPRRMRNCQSMATSQPPFPVKKLSHLPIQMYLWADMLFFMKSNGPLDFLDAGILMRVLILTRKKFLFKMGWSSMSYQLREILFKIRILLLFN
jgi:hypothetical protein